MLLKMRYLKYLFLSMMFLGFFLLRPYHLQETGLFYAGDDDSYFSHAASIAFGQFPNYEKEYVPTAYASKGNVPLHSIGLGLMASPFVFLGAQIDRLLNPSIFEKRTREVNTKSWAGFGFVLATMLYFYLAMIFLYKGLSLHYGEKITFISLLLMLIFQILGLYIFRRSVFSHIYEFALQSFCVYFLLKNPKLSFKYLVLLGLITGLITLVRYNNFLFSLMWPIILLCFKEEKFVFKQNIKNLFIVYLVSGFLIFLFKIFPMLFYGAKEAYVSNTFINFISPVICAKKFLHIVFGIDFGLIFTAPFVLLGFVWLFFYKGELKRRLVYILCPIVLNIFLNIIWVGTIQGCWYGYRYFLFSLIPVMIIPFTDFIQKNWEKPKVKFFLMLLAIFPILSLLSFEGNNALSLVQKTDGWINLTYQLEIWKMIFLHPIQYFVVIFKGCFLYFLYLAAFLFNVTNKLPDIVLKIYPYFNIILFIRVIIIFLFPLAIFCITKKIETKKV